MIKRTSPIEQIMTNFGSVSGRPRKIYTGSAVTAGSGIATLYLTDDGTISGAPLMNTIEGFWSSAITTGVAGNTTDSRNYAQGANFVQARAYREGGILSVLGLSVLGVPTFPTGVTISFIVWGD